MNTISDKEKIEMYETLLHKIQLCSEVCMDSVKVGKLIRNICRWSRAHRIGNGEIEEERVDSMIESCFNKLLNMEDD